MYIKSVFQLIMFHHKYAVMNCPFAGAVMSPDPSSPVKRRAIRRPPDLGKKMQSTYKLSVICFESNYLDDAP